MRGLALLSAALVTFTLAGCTQGSPGQDFEGTCPSWTKRQDSYQTSKSFFYNGSAFDGPHKSDGYPPEGASPDADPYRFALGAGFEEKDGRPLDRIQLRFEPNRVFLRGATVLNAQVEGLVTDARTGEVLPVADYRHGANHRADRIHFGPGTAGNLTIDVVLAEADQAPEPTAVRIDWYFTPEPDASEEDPSLAALALVVTYWYRQCSSDGTRFP